MTDSRLLQLGQWVTATLSQRQLASDQDSPALTSVSGDASFRRYFRAATAAGSLIAVDAPPTNEDSRTFVAVGDLLRQAGVLAPEVYAADFDQGFMLLEDFGDSLYLERLLQYQQAGELELASELYTAAIGSLLDMQAGVDKQRLRPYDRAELHRELSLFTDWFCGRWLELELTSAEQALVAATFRQLEDAALGQAEVAVHRDYHSRNLLLLARGDDKPGVIDFQDAVRGAYTYDLVSLLRDAYIAWPREQVNKWALTYLERAIKRGIVANIDRAQFIRDFDLMGLQRQLKVIGIFARLAIRDNKPGYLADIPLVIDYFLDTSRHYDELASFTEWFERRVLPLAEPRFNRDS